VQFPSLQELFMTKKLIFALAGMTLFAANAFAAVTTYTDRATFEAAAAGHITDNLNNVTDGSGGGGLDRGSYAWTMNSFGCNSGPSMCGDNQIDGMQYPAYVWTYESGSFNFDNAIHAFGFDYGSYYNSTATVALNGYAASTTNGGFFGIIDTNAFSTVQYTADYANLFDNVTYSTSITSAVPEPETYAMMLAGLGLIGAIARRRKAKQTA